MSSSLAPLFAATLTFLNEKVQRYNATPGQDFMLNACATNLGNADIGRRKTGMVTVNWTKDNAPLDVALPDYFFNDATDVLTIFNYNAFADNGTYNCVVTYNDSTNVTITSRSVVVSIDGKWVIDSMVEGLGRISPWISIRVWSLRALQPPGN